MLAVYAEDADLARRTARRLGDSGRPEIFEEWLRLRKLFPRPELVAVASPDPSAELLARMQALKHLDPLVPFLLVTRRNPDALRRLKNLVIEEVVWADEIEEAMPRALLRADGERRFREIEARLREPSHLSPTLVAALARAVRRRPPLTSVRALAAEVDRDRRTVWHHWKDAFGDGDLTPKGFLDWVLLLRARTHRTDGTSWQRVARELGVHTRTLRRVADRRLEAHLDEVGPRDVDAMFGTFERSVVGPLLSDDAGATPDPG